MGTSIPDWPSWRNVSRDLYTQTMQGYPTGEMRRYWRQGISPEEAVELAKARRKVISDKSEVGRAQNQNSSF
jgi:hypothetical protein